jgi:hypothetical protein
MICLNQTKTDLTSSELEIQYLLDAKKEKTTKRLFFLKHEGLSALNRTVVVSKGRDWKDSFTVHLPASGIHDKLTSIDVQASPSFYCCVNNKV